MSARRWDYPLLLTTLGLTAFGLVMVFSASYATAQEWTGTDLWFFATRQALWALFGMVGLAVAALLPLRVVRTLAPWVFAGCLILLALVFIVGVERHGARRWLDFGVLSLQPSEFAKLGLIAFLAWVYADRSAALAQGRALFPGLAAIALTAGLVVAGRDLGTALVLGAVGWLMLHLAGARLRHLLAVGAVAAGVVAFLIWYEPYRRERVLAFLNPWQYPDDSGYQVIQALIALGSGGWFGLGLGESRQKFFYLPAPMTDSIFAVVGEELGLVGTLAVLAAFVFLLWRGLGIARRAGDAFAALLAGGVTLLLATQAAVHMGVMTSLLPTTGLPLPFISYGGSALVTVLVGVGLLLNVSRHARRARYG